MFLLATARDTSHSMASISKTGGDCNKIRRFNKIVMNQKRAEKQRIYRKIEGTSLQNEELRIYYKGMWERGSKDPDKQRKDLLLCLN